VSEAELERAVRDLLKLTRLYGYHTRDSRGSAAGFPDWCIIGKRVVLWRELKSEVGQLTSEQRRVRDMLVATGANWAVWRPSDLHSGRIFRELKAIAR
jgi:hypothetical protein